MWEDNPEGMAEKAVFVMNESGERLSGLEAVPASKKKSYPAVVMVHGFGVDRSEWGMFDEFSKILCDKGFVVYRFDSSGCGESEGDYAKTSLTKLRGELLKILEFVRTRPFVDKGRIGIMAQSFGTTTTAVLEPEVACIVMTSSVSNPAESLKLLFGEGYNPSGISTRSRSDGKKTSVGPVFWSELERYDALASVKRINCPLLFVSGSDDTRVRITQMEAFYEAANEPKKKVILDGANHQLKPRWEELYRLALEWFERYLEEGGQK
jgi:dipeptidyl aminopeptidase/acylaminoacyl peptidase